MKKIIFPLLMMVAATSCNLISDAKNEASTSLTESLIEKATGQKVDMVDVKNLDKNKALVKLTMGDENLEPIFKGAMGNISGSKEILSFTVQLEKGNEIYFVMIGFLADDVSKLKPIKGKVNGKQNGAANLTLMISTISENGMVSVLSNDAEGEVISLSDEKAVVRIKGKVYEPMNVKDPSKWKDVEGTVEFEYPIFTTMGIKKEELKY